MKISGVYKIVNTITGDFYIGSSKNVKLRWANHKCPSSWSEHPNSLLYQDMQKYGVDKFDFQILSNVEPEHLKETEQQFIEMLHPTYNNYRAKGQDIGRYKEWQTFEKSKEAHRKASNKYNHQLCFYNGNTLPLCTLAWQFSKIGIEHPTSEAKKYLLNK